MSSEPPQMQVDVGNIPTNSLMLLGSLQPMLQALSADDVQPLAVLQLRDIGALFHLNGPFAEKIPDLLVRSNSVRLERLSLWVGWRKNDTASLMAQTLGGRVAALLSLILRELADDESTVPGGILYKLSSATLPPNSCNSSPLQLNEVTKILSRKMRAIGFGNHLANQATRIRQVYLCHNMPIPDDLLEMYTEENIVELLQRLHRALTDENLCLTFEGTISAAYTAAIVTAICPEDVLLVVQGEIIHRGLRKKIIVNIDAAQKSSFFLATKLGPTVDGVPVFLNRVPRSGFARAYPSLKWNGLYSNLLDLAFLKIGESCPPSVKQACCDLVGTAAVRRSILNGSRTYDPLFLLGVSPCNRVRDSLTMTFGLEPVLVEPFQVPMFNQESQLTQEIFGKLADEMMKIFLGDPEAYSCPEYEIEIFGEYTVRSPSAFLKRHFGTRRISKCSCKAGRLFKDIENILARAFYSIFVDAHSDDLCVSHGSSSKRTSFVDFMSEVRGLVDGYDNYAKASKEPSFMENIIQFVLCDKADSDTVGSCDGVLSLFPDHLINPSLNLAQGYVVHLYDGQFYDFDRNLIKRLRGDGNPRAASYATNGSDLRKALSWGPPRQECSHGVHSNLMMACKVVNYSEAHIQTSFEWQGQMVWRNFSDVMAAFCDTTIADPCHHEPDCELDASKTAYATSVAYPICSTDIVSSGPKLSVCMTRGNPEAQFLACFNQERSAINEDNQRQKIFFRTYPKKILYQGSACLNCAYDQAMRLDCALVICS